MVCLVIQDVDSISVGIIILVDVTLMFDAATGAVAAGTYTIEMIVHMIVHVHTCTTCTTMYCNLYESAIKLLQSGRDLVVKQVPV